MTMKIGTKIRSSIIKLIIANLLNGSSRGSNSGSLKNGMFKLFKECLIFSGISMLFLKLYSKGEKTLRRSMNAVMTIVYCNSDLVLSI